jgi:hypothetical protein
MAVFGVVAPYSLVEVYRRFRRACCSIIMTPTSDCCRENLKSHINQLYKNQVITVHVFEKVLTFRAHNESY